MDQKTKKILTSLTIFIIFAILSIYSISCQQKKIEELSFQPAEHWLTLVDEEQYRATWNGLSCVYKKHQTREEWIHYVNQLRKPLGVFFDRQLIHKKIAEDINEDDIGEHIVCQYESSFEHGESVIEVVLMIKDNNEEWKIFSYFIQQEK